MARRTPEQVHEQDGHADPVRSCSLCTVDVVEVEDRTTEAEPVEVLTTEAPAPPVSKYCRIPNCGRAVLVNRLCGAHYASRRGG